MCSKGRPNQSLHADRGRTLVSRDIALLQRPRRVNFSVSLEIHSSEVPCLINVPATGSVPA
jgi:hypothetical protein